MMTGLYEVLK